MASVYRAFLSYSHKDAAWGAKLHRRLESYKLPKRLAGTETARGTVPGRLAPVFRDREELSAGESLSDTIKAALAASDSLIVMCSPAARASPWVAKEIALFRELHPDRPVLAALVEGEPAEAIPDALTNLPGTGRGTTRRVVEGQVPEEALPSERTPDVPLHPSPSASGPPPRAGEVLEPIAADFRKSGDGERLALLKLVAGMTGVPLDALVQRDAQRQMRRVTAITSAALAAVLVMALLTTFAFRAQREAERQRAEAEGLVEYMLTDLRDRLKGVGRLDVMTAVNERAMRYYGGQGDLSRLPTESLLRRARVLHAMGEDDETRGDFEPAMDKFIEAHRTTAAIYRREPNDWDAIFVHAQSEYWIGRLHELREEWPKALFRFRRYADLANLLVRQKPADAISMKEVAWGWRNQAHVELRGLKQPLSARQKCLEALRWFQMALKRRPNDRAILSEIAETHAWLADTYYDMSDHEASVAQRRAQLLIRSQLASAYPRDSQQNGLLGDAHFALAVNLMRSKKWREVRDHLSKAVQIFDELMKIEPNNAEWRYQAGRVWAAEILAAKSAGDADAASKALDNARSISQRASENLDPFAEELTSLIDFRRTEAGI